MVWLYVLLYLLIGSAYSLIVFRHIIHLLPFRIIWATVITWPISILILILNILTALLDRLHKVLLVVFSTKIVWFIILVLIFAGMITKCKAHAATITGDTPLAGISVLFAEKARQGITWYDPEDLELLAQVLEHENYSNGERAMYLTGAVVINRRNSPRWPNTIREVIYQTNPRQYSTTNKFWSRPVHQECYRIASWLLIFGCPDVPPNVVYQAMFKQGSGVYEFINTDYFCYE